MRILILTNSIRPEYNFRRERIQAFIDAGHQVAISCPPADLVEHFVEMGCSFIPSSISQYSKNPFLELQVLSEYVRLLHAAKPDVIITSSIKPNVWGGFASQITGVPQIANVTGLGAALENPGPGQKLGVSLYRAALRNVRFLNFQNMQNRTFFRNNRIAADRDVRFSPGSGVNLDHFSFSPKPEVGVSSPNEPGLDSRPPLRLLFVGRIQKAKGVDELLQAAKTLADDGDNIQVSLLGRMVDDYSVQIDQLAKLGVVEYLGVASDVRPHIREADAVILPSHHEGLANVLLEAASIGRPVLASRIPGCQEAFDEEVTGLGFTANDTESLVNAVKHFSALGSKARTAMGRAGRLKMEREFDRRIVVQEYLNQVETINRESRVAQNEDPSNF